uniref:Uncharacterized protein n=1 Tax=Knipowitschia caucasica TaxID=637954 RepID=A0AAV2KF84_KNICA
MPQNSPCHSRSTSFGSLPPLSTLCLRLALAPLPTRCSSSPSAHRTQLPPLVYFRYLYSSLFPTPTASHRPRLLRLAYTVLRPPALCPSTTPPVLASPSASTSADLTRLYVPRARATPGPLRGVFFRAAGHLLRYPLHACCVPQLFFHPSPPVPGPPTPLLADVLCLLITPGRPTSSPPSSLCPPLDPTVISYPLSVVFCVPGLLPVDGPPVGAARPSVQPGSCCPHSPCLASRADLTGVKWESRSVFPGVCEGLIPPRLESLGTLPPTLFPFRSFLLARFPRHSLLVANSIAGRDSLGYLLPCHYRRFHVTCESAFSPASRPAVDLLLDMPYVAVVRPGTVFSSLSQPPHAFPSSLAATPCGLLFSSAIYAPLSALISCLYVLPLFAPGSHFCASPRGYDLGPSSPVVFHLPSFRALPTSRPVALGTILARLHSIYLDLAPWVPPCTTPSSSSVWLTRTRGPGSGTPPRCCGHFPRRRVSVWPGPTLGTPLLSLWHPRLRPASLAPIPAVLSPTVSVAALTTYPFVVRPVFHRRMWIPPLHSVGSSDHLTCVTAARPSTQLTSGPCELAVSVSPRGPTILAGPPLIDSVHCPPPPGSSRTLD